MTHLYLNLEKLFLNLHKELPYSIAVKTDNYEIMENGNVKIHQTIFVLKESQKSIIVGKKGEMIKKLGQESTILLSLMSVKTIKE